MEKKYKILLVEDDEDDYFFFNYTFTSFYPDSEVIRVYDGLMLSSLMQTGFTPDVIFLDINLPFKSGIECLKDIRRNCKCGDVQVIMYSTSSTATDINKSFKAGADFYITKPTMFSSALKQFATLFGSYYFKNKIKPPEGEFTVEDLTNQELQLEGNQIAA